MNQICSNVKELLLILSGVIMELWFLLLLLSLSIETSTEDFTIKLNYAMLELALLIVNFFAF